MGSFYSFSFFGASGDAVSRLLIGFAAPLLSDTDESTSCVLCASLGEYPSRWRAYLTVHTIGSQSMHMSSRVACDASRWGRPKDEGSGCLPPCDRDEFAYAGAAASGLSDSHYYATLVRCFLKLPKEGRKKKRELVTPPSCRVCSRRLQRRE